MITVEKAEVRLTEQTLREMLRAVDEVKEHTCFTNKPMPDGDMDSNTFHRLRMERGFITIESHYSGIRYLISLEVVNETQESLGYKVKEASDDSASS